MSESETRMECGAGSESIQDKSVNRNGGSRDESEGADQSDHPLLNDVVLRKVFEHLKPRDLMTCRGVCKKWNTSTIPFTRSKCLVRIEGNRLNRLPKSMQEFSFGGDYEGEETRGIEDFIQVFSKNQLGIPFGKFRLGSFCMTDGAGQEFVKLCGDFVQYINLSNNDRFDVEDVSELLKSVPNLMKFRIPRSLRSRSGNAVKLFPEDGPKPKLSCMEKLKSHKDYPEERGKFCPTFIEELITAGENISHLSLTNSFINDKMTKCTSLEALIAIDKLNRESSIQALKFCNMDRVPEHIELLSRMQAKGMKLKKVDASGFLLNPLHIPLATLFKDTLEYQAPGVCSSFMGFPTMPRLKSLVNLSMTNFDSGCINIRKMFPALEKLMLCHLDGDVYDEFFPDSEPCENIESFILSSGIMRLKPFTRIHTVFPNLTELKLDVSVDGVEILRSIWSGMSQLKVLKLKGEIETKDNENLDSIFTGLTIRELQEIKNLVKALDGIRNKKLTTETIQGMINGTSQDLPSIRNLTNLSHLHLSVTGQGKDEQGTTTTYLTPMTGYFSLYSMKQIRHLMVEKCQFTKSCCEILATDMGLQSWKFVSSDFASIIPEMEED